jgi:3'(2'), 5'-bisphosphate nucleotidase
MSHESEREAGIEAVLKACRLCRDLQSAESYGDALGKRDGSPVTIADFGVQALVSLCLKASFPEDPLVAEEETCLLERRENVWMKSAVAWQVRRIFPDLSDRDIFNAIQRGSGEIRPLHRFWTLDPIDGTKGFLRGAQYAIALGLIEEGRVVLGVMGCPNFTSPGPGASKALGCLFAAVAGNGARMKTLDGSLEWVIHVSSETEPSQALFCESFESSHSWHDALATIMKLLGVQRPVLRLDSQCKYGVVARGDASVYLRVPPPESSEENIWDHAAGALIVEEAGGRVTDLRGKPLDFTRGKKLLNNWGILATNGRLHDQVLEAVQQVL